MSSSSAKIKNSKQQLLDESSSDDDSSDDVARISQSKAKSILNINRKYAREFDQRKRREELRTARQAGEDVDDLDTGESSSEEEDEDGDLLSPSLDLNIIRTIKALRNKDDSIYDKDSRFFPSLADEGSESKKKERNLKPMRYKDVVREQVLETMKAEERGEEVNRLSDDDEASSRIRKTEESPSKLAYDQEQKDLRAAFLKSTTNGSDDEEYDGSEDYQGDTLMMKKKAGNDSNSSDNNDQLLKDEIMELGNSGVGQSGVVDPRGEVDDGENFLLDFLKNKRWVDKSSNIYSSDGDEEERGVIRSKALNNESDGNESDEELEKMDAFESKYNFRFEEAAAAAEKEKEGVESGAAYSVVGYARGGAPDTLRRTDDSRKLKRLARKEKKAAERKAKEERLRRLKNAKKDELEGRMKQVSQVIGSTEEEAGEIDEASLMKLMEGDYDPEKFEKIMSDAYGEDFYEKGDDEWKTDADVKESLAQNYTGVEGDIINADTKDMYGDDENEELANTEDWQEGADEGGADDSADVGGEEFEIAEEEKGIETKLREKMMDELYKLDYEDIIGDMPTRFKYRKVEANRYGLAPQEILFAKDETLKQFVSLKRMAPYQQGEEYHCNSKKRRRFRDLAKLDFDEVIREEGIATVDADEESGEQRADGKKKTRRRQKKKKGQSTADDELQAQKAEITSAAKQAVIDENDSSELIADESGSKRRRKKKGRKGEKRAKAVEVGDDSPLPEDKTNKSGKEKERIHDERDQHKVDKPSSRKKKKKKKKKMISIDGVSKSRLAAYGL